VRVTLTRSGGFVAAPALSQPISLDTATLPDTQAAEVERLVDHALAAEQPSSGGAADYVTYSLTVDRGDPVRQDACQFRGPVLDPVLSELLDTVQALGTRDGAGSVGGQGETVPTQESTREGE
jgi:hypothetical protein